MVETIPQELELTLKELRDQVAMLSERLAKMETAPSAAPVASAPPQPIAQQRESITEEELLAISGALAAYLGVRVHIRQIRLISSRAWASEGRVTIQASHRLHS